MELKEIIKTNLNMLMKESINVDDIIHYLIIVAEFRRGYISGAFTEIVNRYDYCDNVTCIFRKFWHDVIRRENSALNILESLRGDREILTIMENIFSVTLFNMRKNKEELFLSSDEVDVILEKVEEIRDRWLDQVMDGGIESPKTAVWEPQVTFDETTNSWSLVSIPMSYKLFKDLIVFNDMSIEKGIDAVKRFIETRCVNEQAAYDLFRIIVNRIKDLGRDTVQEKFELVRMLNQYRYSWR